jgi:hypothetical protein
LGKTSIASPAFAARAVLSIYKSMPLPDTLETRHDTVFHILAVCQVLRTDFVGIKIGHRKLGPGKILFPIVLELLLELSIHK